MLSYRLASDVLDQALLGESGDAVEVLDASYDRLNRLLARVRDKRRRERVA